MCLDLQCAMTARMTAGSDCSGNLLDGVIRRNGTVVAVPGAPLLGLSAGCLASTVAGSCKTFVSQQAYVSCSSCYLQLHM